MTTANSIVFDIKSAIITTAQFLPLLRFGGRIWESKVAAYVSK